MKTETMNNNNRFFSPLFLREGLRVRLFFALFLSLFSFASCTQESLVPDTSGEDARHEIVLSASMGDISSEVTPGTRGEYDPAASNTLYFARRDRNTDGTWPVYSSSALNGGRLGGAGYTSVTFLPVQYYPMGKRYGQENSNSYNEVQFVSWYPQHTSNVGGVVTIANNGKGDIMLSNEITGSYSNKFTSSANTLTYKHLMAKITVQVKAADAGASNLWGALTGFVTLGQPNECTITLPGQIQWSSISSWMSLEGFSQISLTTAYQVIGTGFIKPNVSSLVLQLSTVNGGVRDLTVVPASGNFLAGTAYTISLDFKSNIIAPSASVTAWNTSNASTDL